MKKTGKQVKYKKNSKAKKEIEECLVKDAEINNKHLYKIQQKQGARQIISRTIK